jgi:hypothetical protein
MIVISGQSRFRNRKHPGSKRGGEHERGNGLDRLHFNLLFVQVKTSSKILCGGMPVGIRI